MSFQEYYETQIAPVLIRADNVLLDLLKIKSTLNSYDEIDIRLLVNEDFLLKRGTSHIAFDIAISRFRCAAPRFEKYLCVFSPHLQVLTAVSPALRASTSLCGSTMDASLWWKNLYLDLWG